ncbi:MAG: alpha/beta hydrolase domain-containing protein [Actinomycetota bacterium]
MQTRRALKKRLCALTVALISVLLGMGSAHAGVTGVPNPVVWGPVSGGIHGRPWNSSIFPVAPRGYSEQEYFFSGIARTLAANYPATAPYTTRMLVRIPTNPEKFNGTVFVEWLNVTGTADLETLWPSTGEYLMSHGYGWVGVSAQLVGVCCGPLSLKGWDPVRYANLVHPGDSYSYDIFSQAMQALRHPELNRTTVIYPSVVDPMNGLKIEHLVAHGASQSAGTLTTYINTGYNAGARLADAFLITRGGGPYTSFDQPIMNINEEGNFSTTQPDNPNFRLWQEAGIAHAPLGWWKYQWAMQTRDLGDGNLPDAANVACSFNRGTSQYTHRAAVFWMNEWLTEGTPPPSAPRLLQDSSGAVVRDSNGLAEGGLRYPFISVPVAGNSAQGCPLFGAYYPWPKEKIIGLYPTQADYVNKVDVAANDLVAGGFLLPEDAAEVKSEARAFNVWTNGSCFDTASPTADESGPVSSALHSLTYNPALNIGNTGLPADVHDVSCNVFAANGL